LNTTTERERAERGAELLDVTMPGWPNMVDPKRLDIRSACDCVGGQLAGNGQNYITTMNRLGLRDREQEAAHGFDVVTRNAAHAAVIDEYAALTAAWRNLITERQAAGS
jgi:hypothetical protein